MGMHADQFFNALPTTIAMKHAAKADMHGMAKATLKALQTKFPNGKRSIVAEKFIAHFSSDDANKRKFLPKAIRAACFAATGGQMQPAVDAISSVWA